MSARYCVVVIISQVRPARRLRCERSCGEIDRAVRRDCGFKGRVLPSIGWPWGARRLGQEQEAVERHLGDSRTRLLGRIVHAERPSGATKARPMRVEGTISKGRRKQVVEMPAIRWNWRLRLFDQGLRGGSARRACRQASGWIRDAALRRGASTVPDRRAPQTTARRASR